MIRLIPGETIGLSVNWSDGPSVHLHFFTFIFNMGIACDFFWFHFQAHYGDHAWRNILTWSSDS